MASVTKSHRELYMPCSIRYDSVYLTCSRKLTDVVSLLLSASRRQFVDMHNAVTMQPKLLYVEPGEY